MNTPIQEEQKNQAACVSFGERIRQAREERQLSIDDLVGETRIHPQHLIDLEEGKTSGISAPGYVVGYLKTLAKVLELDAEELISDFKSAFDESEHRSIDPDHELLPPKSKKKSLSWSTILATTIIVLAGIGAILYYWWDIASDRNANPTETEIVDDETSNVDQSEQTDSEGTEEVNTIGSSDQSSGSLDGELGTEGGADVPLDRNGAGDITGSNGLSGPADQTNTNWEDLMNLTQGSPIDDSPDNASEVPEQEENLVDDVESSTETADSEDTDDTTEEEPPLLFEFSDVSFVEVTDADDNQLVSETKQPGTKLELDGTAPFTIKLGFAPGVTLFYNGDKVDLTPHTRRNIAEFTLPP